MRTSFMALGAFGLLSVAGCAQVFTNPALTNDEKVCLAAGAALAVDQSEVDFGELTAKQKAAFVAQIAEGVTAGCAVELTPAAQTVIATAITIAADE